MENINTTIISISSKDNEVPAFEMSSPIIHMGMDPLSYSQFGKIKWYLKVIPSLARLVKKLNPDIILSVGHNISFMMPFISKRRIVYACEHIDFTTIPKISKLLIKIAYSKLSGIIVLSETAKRKIKSINKNIMVIPNSISIKSLHPLLRNDIFQLIMVGRISQEKGFERIIPIAKELKRHTQNFCINIYGDGPMRNEVENLIDLNKLSDVVHMNGYEKNIAQKYEENSILLLTSYTEALPMVIIEANSFGLPVIAYDNEGVQELVIDGQNGYSINSDDVKTFVDKILYLINDMDKLNAMRNSSYEISKLYSEEKIAIKWSKLLNGITVQNKDYYNI